MRNALDQAVYGASSALGASRLDNVFFPFRQNPTDLERAFTGKGRCTDVPAELHPIIKSFEPYPRGSGYSGGDDVLRHLGTISNPNKHSIALRVHPSLAGPLEIGISHAPGAVKRITPRWNSGKTRVAILELVKSTDFYYNINATADVAFAEPPIEGVPVGSFFKEQLPRVQTIIDRLESETKRIISLRP